MRHSSATADLRLRIVLVLSALVLLPAVTKAADAPLGKFLDTYCLSCHNAVNKKGGLDLEKQSADYKEPAAFATWVKVHDRIQAGEMPPRAHRRPNKAEAGAFLQRLETGLTNADRAHRAGEGRAVFRRLNRTEYENTLRNLLCMPSLKVKDLLPEDGRAFGYDKSAAGLDLSHVQLAKYLEAADVALDAAIAPHAARPVIQKLHLYPGAQAGLKGVALNGDAVFLKDGKYDLSIGIPVPREKGDKKVRDYEMSGVFPYKGSVGIFRHEDEAFRPSFKAFAPAYAGRYRLRISLWSFAWDKGEVKPNPRTESASLVVDGRVIGYFDAPSLKPTVHEVEVSLNAKEGDPLQRCLVVADTSQRTARTGRRICRLGIAIDWFEAEGPLLDQWPPASHRRLFGGLAMTPIPPQPKQKKKEPSNPTVWPKRPPPQAFHCAASRIR